VYPGSSEGWSPSHPRLKGNAECVTSHWHWDHTGDPSTFPPKTELVVNVDSEKGSYLHIRQIPKASLTRKPSRELSFIREQCLVFT